MYYLIKGSGEEEKGIEGKKEKKEKKENIEKEEKENKEEKDYKKGDSTWSMVYDEGFEIRLGPVKIFFFSMYFKNKNDKKFLSNCARTLIGWYHNNKTNEFCCVRAIKSGGKDIINKANAQLLVLQNTVEGKVENNFRFKKVGSNLKLNLGMNLKFHQTFVNRINSLKNVFWKARVNEKFAKMSVREVNKNLGK